LAHYIELISISVVITLCIGRQNN